jgi:hypothetical protein
MAGFERNSSANAARPARAAAAAADLAARSDAAVARRSAAAASCHETDGAAADENIVAGCDYYAAALAAGTTGGKGMPLAPATPALPVAPLAVMLVRLTLPTTDVIITGIDGCPKTALGLTSMLDPTFMVTLLSAFAVRLPPDAVIGLSSVIVPPVNSVPAVILPVVAPVLSAVMLPVGLAEKIMMAPPRFEPPASILPTVSGPAPMMETLPPFAPVLWVSRVKLVRLMVPDVGLVAE